MEQRVVQMGIGGVGMAIHPRAHLGEVGEVLGGAWYQLFARLGNHLTAVVGLGFRESGHVVRDQFPQFAYQPGALRRCGCSPFWKSGLGGGDRCIDFSRAAFSHFCKHLLGGRIDGFKVGFARYGLAVDQVVDPHAYPYPCAMVFISAPTPSISVMTTSPGWQSTTPSGVPVRIRSPGSSVMKLEKYSMRKGMGKIMSRVLPD